MRFRRPVALFVGIVLQFAPVQNSHAAGGHEKQRVLVLALDCSGSMTHSDPGRRRIEAAELLVAAADQNDQVGVIAFGDGPRWLGPQPVSIRSQFQLRTLQSVGQSDRHTDFAALFREWNRFLDGEPDGYFETHEVSLVVLTDGVPDSANETSAENGQEALNLANRAARNSSINVIALGREAKSGSFLSDLSVRGHGRSAYADSDKELTDAFLKVATAVLHLPAFQKLDTPGKLENFGSADRSLLIFLGSGTLHPKLGSPILENNVVKVLDASGLVPGTRIAWDGNGTVFICRREPLIFRSATEIPLAGLLNEPATISLGLYNGDKDQSGAFFLKNSELQIIARPKSTGPQQTLPFLFTAMGKFQGSLALAEPGEYHLSARLRAPYGDLEQSLGDFRVSATAVDLPAQVTLDIFPGVPGRLLATKVRAGLLLPIGSGQVTIPDVAGISVSPSVVTFLPNHPETITLFVSPASPAGEIIEVPYKVTWKNGVRTTQADSILRVALRRLTFGEAFRALWIWISLAFSLILLLTFLVRSFAPRNLRGKLQISKEGMVLYSLILPSDLRSRRLQIKADRDSRSVNRSGAVVNVPSETDGMLLTIESKRHNGRWTAVVTPGSSRVQAAGQNLFAPKPIEDLPRSQLLIPSFNLTVTFR